MSAAHPDRFRRLRRVAAWLPLLGLLALYTVVQAWSFTPGTIEADCEGYFILGKRLAAGEPAGVVEPDPFLFQTHVWVRNARGELLPKYDPGYPLLVGLAARIGGDRAAFLVSPLCGGLTILGAWLLFHLWMRPFAAALATAVFATNPAFLNYASYPLAHIPDLMFLVWGAWALWRWLRQPTSWGSAIAAGLLLGTAASMRHTSILFAAPTAIAVLSVLGVDRARRRAGRWPALALCAAYAVVPAALAFYQWRWFGSPCASGYALSGEQDAFQWRYAVANFTNLGWGLNVEIAFWVAPLGLIGILTTGPWRDRLMRGLWFLGTYVVYLAYYWAPASLPYYRFLLPTVPLLVGSTFLLLDTRVPTVWGRRLALIATVAICAAHAWPRWERRALSGKLFCTQANNHVAAARAVEPYLDADAVLFLQGPLDRGMGAYRRYVPYALDAFRPYRVVRTMPAWIDPLSEEGRSLAQRDTWLIHAQEARRLELTAIYDELGREGLSRQRQEVAVSWLRLGRQVGILVPSSMSASVRAEFPDLTLTPRATFATPSIGEWTLLTVTSSP